MSDADGLLDGRVQSLVSGIRFGKFVSVGMIGAVCDTIVLLTLDEGLGVPFEIATLLGIETAILVMFTINEHWTFKDHGDDGRSSLFARLKRSHMVRAVGSTTQFLISWVIYRALFVPLTPGDIGFWGELTQALGLGAAFLAGLDLWLLIAKGSGIGIGMVVNYVFESLFTWQIHREGESVEHGKN